MTTRRHRKVVPAPRIALTGGIASGKSTVATLFTALGARLIDTDQIARDVVAPPSTVLERIAARFGPEVITAAGTLDRARLRGIVFADPAARLGDQQVACARFHRERPAFGQLQVCFGTERRTGFQFHRLPGDESFPGGKRTAAC